MEKRLTLKLLEISSCFDFEDSPTEIIPISVGLINETYKLNTNKKAYLLQRINKTIFKSPAHVMSNIEKVGEWLEQKKYPRHILQPLLTREGRTFYQDVHGEYWRLFPFFEDTITFNEISKPDLAYEAAFAFGEYTSYLSDFDHRNLHTTIPDFHHTPLRFVQFEHAIKTAKPERLSKAKSTIKLAKSFTFILKHYDLLKQNIRVVHYDTKINNLLLHKDTLKAVCVIDLDTLMPGMLPYDYGDMVRTFTSPVDENEPDIRQVIVRLPILEALKAGFLDGLKDQILREEKAHLDYGAQLIIFEQALRFLTDYLQNDVYYPIAYESQNLDRSANQLALLQGFLAKIKI